jgi:hypothetical protein
MTVLASYSRTVVTKASCSQKICVAISTSENYSLIAYLAYGKQKQLNDFSTARIGGGRIRANRFEILFTRVRSGPGSDPSSSPSSFSNPNLGKGRMLSSTLKTNQPFRFEKLSSFRKNCSWRLKRPVTSGGMLRLWYGSLLTAASTGGSWQRIRRKDQRGRPM